ncbi:MAG: hypothetical protein UZ08_BCD001000243 [Candidatus Parvibacillus calidus]|jgi:hypothetical protein|nr:MAG: hypothetical protein UZ08_BCD001000243 [Candidatus Parvibacillus calidus]
MLPGCFRKFLKLKGDYNPSTCASLSHLSLEGLCMDDTVTRIVPASIISPV